MSLHINRFLDRIRTVESRHQRDVVMTVTEARDLHSDITRLLLQLEQATRELAQAREQDQVIKVEIGGSEF